VKRRALLAAYLAVSAGVATAVGVAMIRDEAPAAEATAGRPTLALLTSLPLVFGENFSLEGGGSPALTRLEQRYKVLPISVADAASLKGQKLLLMAHPRAQPAEALVDLDRWVRDGGGVLLLADPKLDWPSERPLGDLLRPPPAFADTGLLGHWGLRLSSPGSLESSGKCRVRDQGLVARCRIGRGQATIVADADFLNVDGPEATGLDLMMTELDRLETR
jgi:hypothetical protein